MGDSLADFLRLMFDDKKMFLRRRWYVWVPAIAGFIGGVIFWAVQPKVYESSSLIIAEEARTPLPFFGSSVGRRISMIREQIVDINNLVQVVDHLNLARDLKTEKEYEKLILGLRRKIAVRLKGQNLFEISFRSRNPGEAAAVVGTLDDMFIARHRGAFIVYKRPQMPSRAVAPNLLAAVAAGVLLGACAGMGLVLLLEYRVRQTES